MISTSFRKHWPSLAKQLRDTPEGVLCDPLGEAHIDLSFACALWRYDAGALYLHAIYAKARSLKPERWTGVVALLKDDLIAIDALKLPPAELEEEVLASPRLFDAARRAA